MAQARFLELPVHLCTMILERLDSMQSLGSAILSHSLLYAAYKEDPNSVISNILWTQIPTNLLVYARAVMAATLVDTRDADKQVGVLFDHFADISLVLAKPEWPIRRQHLEPRVAYGLSETYAAVAYFADAFIKDTLQRAREELGVSRPEDAGATATERFRICRALYRFQLFCKLGFRSDDDLVPDEALRHSRKRWQEVYFFGFFAPWVNEQLACIHDYLERELSVAFDQVAAHDVEWGAKSVDWLARGKRNEHKQALLSNGLHFLFKLSRCKGYEEQAAMLKVKGLPRTGSMLAAHFRRAAVVDDFIYYPASLHPLATWDAETIELLRRRFADGPTDGTDSAPFNLWYAANKHFLADACVYNAETVRLRRCGYTMWDLPKGSMESATLEDRVAAARQRSLLDLTELDKAKEMMRLSWEERAEIYGRGGTGFWSSGDLSKITWSENASPKHEPTRETQHERNVDPDRISRFTALRC